MTADVKCSRCNMFGHSEEVCRNVKERALLMTSRGTDRQGCGIRKQPDNDNTRMRHCKNTVNIKDGLRPVKGMINNHVADTLRDTACTTVCVKKKLVLPEQLTGCYKLVKSIYAKNTPNPPKIATFGFCAFSDSTRSTEQHIKS